MEAPNILISTISPDIGKLDTYFLGGVYDI